MAAHTRIAFDRLGARHRCPCTSLSCLMVATLRLSSEWNPGAASGAMGALSRPLQALATGFLRTRDRPHAAPERSQGQESWRRASPGGLRRNLPAHSPFPSSKALPPPPGFRWWPCSSKCWGWVSLSGPSTCLVGALGWPRRCGAWSSRGRTDSSGIRCTSARWWRSLAPSSSALLCRRSFSCWLSCRCRRTGPCLKSDCYSSTSRTTPPTSSARSDSSQACSDLTGRPETSTWFASKAAEPVCTAHAALGFHELDSLSEPTC